MEVSDAIGACWKGKKIGKVSPIQYTACVSPSRSHITQEVRSIASALRCASLFLHQSRLTTMSSCDHTCRNSELQEGTIVKSGSSVMVAGQTSRNKDILVFDYAVIEVDFNKVGCILDRNYGERFGEPICVFGSEKTFRLTAFQHWLPGSLDDGLHRAAIHSPACP